MRLNRKPAIRRGDEATACYAYELGCELALLGRSTDVLDNSVRVDNVEFVIPKRE